MLLSTKEALVDTSSPATYDADTDRIFSISSRTPETEHQRALISGTPSVPPPPPCLAHAEHTGLLSKVPTPTRHAATVQVLPMSDPTWAREGWRPRALLVNPQARHNLLLLEDDGISIVAQFSGDRQLLYAIDAHRLAPGYAPPVQRQRHVLTPVQAHGTERAEAEDLPLHCGCAGACHRGAPPHHHYEREGTLPLTLLHFAALKGAVAQVIGNVETNAHIRYLVHDHLTDTLCALLGVLPLPPSLPIT